MHRAELCHIGWQTLRKFDPRFQFRNPIMFVAYVGAFLSIGFCLLDWFEGTYRLFECLLSLLLFATLLAANFIESVVECRSFIQKSSLQKSKEGVTAQLRKRGNEKEVLANTLKPDDVIICRRGDLIPADGELIEGVASIDESAITGESAPVIRESGSDRSAVTEGTRVISDQAAIRITSDPGKSYIDRMQHLFEENKSVKTANEKLLSLLLSGFSILFLFTTVSLHFFADFSASLAGQHLTEITPIALIALYVSLIPISVSALIKVIRIAGMDRINRLNIVAKSLQAIESAADVDLLILDKTGTLTLGNRLSSEFIPAPGVVEQELAQIAQLASLSDETPEGRSIVVLAKQKFDLRGEHLDARRTRFIPFSAATRLSGVDLTDGEGNVIRLIRKGAEDVIKKHIENLGGEFPEALQIAIDKIAKQGGTPLVVSDNKRVVGVIHLKDVIKGGVYERFIELRKMGLRTLMITGDNPLTAAAIAAEAGIDDFIAEATPEMKLDRIRSEQKKGHFVAMTGDGTSDAPALAQADVGVAMNTGTQESREAGNMVDLDSNPTKLIEILSVGRELLMTRGCLTLFSLASDLAKYFAFLPAFFGSLFPLEALNILNLHSGKSAILSVLIFNILLLFILVPLALRGVRAKPQPATGLLGKHLLLYGVGGLLLPFIGIKAIDLLIGNVLR